MAAAEAYHKLRFIATRRERCTIAVYGSGNGEHEHDVHAGSKGRGGSRVLVLNASYEPLNIVNVRRAVVLVLKEKAEILEQSPDPLRSQNGEFPRPLVIRLSYFVKVPYRVRTSISRRAVFVRDGFTCQYCGSRAENIDHVIPRSRGGQHIWENIVASCRRCNTRKENRLPAEVGLKLMSHPAPPREDLWIIVAVGEVHPAWEPYLDGARPLKTPNSVDNMVLKS